MTPPHGPALAVFDSRAGDRSLSPPARPLPTIRISATRTVESKYVVIPARGRLPHGGASGHLWRDGQNGLPIVFAIAGHHAGLADGLKILNERLQGRGQRRLDAALAARPPAGILDRAVPQLPDLFQPASSKDGDAHRRLELFTRMIFSAP